MMADRQTDSNNWNVECEKAKKEIIDSGLGARADKHQQCSFFDYCCRILTATRKVSLFAAIDFDCL